MTIVSMAVLGRLLVWVFQTSGPTKRIWKLHSLLAEFGECDFCLGCWIYALLAWLFSINLLEPIYVPALSEIITGIAFSFISHLAAMGWKARWGYEVLE